MLVCGTKAVHPGVTTAPYGPCNPRREDCAPFAPPADTIGLKPETLNFKCYIWSSRPPPLVRLQQLCTLRCWSVMLRWRTPHWMLQHYPSMHVCGHIGCRTPPVNTAFWGSKNNVFLNNMDVGKINPGCGLVRARSLHRRISWVCMVVKIKRLHFSTKKKLQGS